MENFCSLVSDWRGEVEWSDHGTLTLVTTRDSALWPVDRDLSPHQSFSGKEDWGGEPTDYLPDLTWSTNNFLSQHNSLLSNIFHVSSVVCQCHHHHDRDQLLPLHHDPHQQLFQYDSSQVFPAHTSKTVLCCGIPATKKTKPWSWVTTRVLTTTSWIIRIREENNPIVTRSKFCSTQQNKVHHQTVRFCSFQMLEFQHTWKYKSYQIQVN